MPRVRRVAPQKASVTATIEGDGRVDPEVHDGAASLGEEAVGATRGDDGADDALVAPRATGTAPAMTGSPLAS